MIDRQAEPPIKHQAQLLFTSVDRSVQHVLAGRLQFSSADFVAKVKRIGARQSMDGKGCWRDSVFVERLSRSAKYEDVYLKAYDGVSAARQSLAAYFEFYNARRPHQSLDGRTPDMIYFKVKALPPIRDAV